MTKKDFISKVAAKSGYSKKDSKEIVDLVLDSIAEAVIEDGELKLIGFGNFEIGETASREGHNPNTGEAMVIPARKRMVFRCAKNIKDILNA